MTSYTFPIDIDAVDTTRSGAYGLLIRHGAREPITADTNMFGAQLTEEGRAQAKALGARLQGRRPHGFYASPVKRCIDTNLCILEGLGMVGEEARMTVKPHSVLGEAFMTDPDVGKASFGLKKPEQLVLDYLDGESVPGFGTIERGARIILDFVRANIVPGTFSVFITHDALVMPFRQHFLGDRWSSENWGPPLGGCVIYTEENRTWINGRIIPSKNP